MENSKGALWTGRVLILLCILFLVVDAGMKIAKAKVSVDGSIQLGWPESGVQGLGIVLMICTILYAIPRTAILGAVLVTAYLGGAVSIMFRAGQPFYFPVVFGVMLWGGLYLTNVKLRSLIPVVKE